MPITAVLLAQSRQFTFTTMSSFQTLTKMFNLTTNGHAA